MRAVVNGEARELAEGVTVADVVGQLTVERRGIAVALNGVVVPKSEWPTATLAPGDSVEVVSAIGGG